MSKRQNNNERRPGALIKHTRRDFVRAMAIGGGAAMLFSNSGCSSMLYCRKDNGKCTYSTITVDYSRCTGCRTCEAVCSAYNHKEEVDGELLLGLGNPHYSNIRVISYNPDVDVPTTCAMCLDIPCIRACPVSHDPKTGHKAIYRDQETGVIKNSSDRCIGCGNCADACETQKMGVIVPNPDTNKPERICTLCDGDPQCVEYCPFEALSFEKIEHDREFYGISPEEIAEGLIKRWYTLEG